VTGYGLPDAAQESLDVDWVHSLADGDPRRWRGSGGASAWVLLHAHLSWHLRRGPDYFASVRDLSLRIGMNQGSVSRGNARLIQGGWLVRQPRTNAPGGADRWRIRSPSDASDPIVSVPQTIYNCVAVMAPDLWRWKGLGKRTFQVWIVLAGRDSWETDELAKVFGVQSRAVERHLIKLSKWELAILRADGSWKAHPGDLEEISSRMSLNSESERQTRRVWTERRNFERLFRERMGFDPITGEVLTQELTGPFEHLKGENE
jgi:DNA-binding transcriptional ArsR family regulator